MKFYYIPNLVTASAKELPGDPWKATIARPKFKDKDTYRAWCKDASTSHAFISLVEGLTPSLRIDRNNPPLVMRGLIIDYDAKMGEDLTGVATKVAARVPAQAPSPQWICSTYSGGARLVFLFEKPLLVDNPELAERVMSELEKRLALGRLLPGIDKTTFELNRYFEIGTNWTPIPNAEPSVSEDFVMTCVFEAGRKANIVTSDTLIPIEVVADEVSKQFPGAWPGAFDIGQRGPLFWMKDGIDRIGAQVAEHGMVCYSDRAPKSFMQWRDIFGDSFVKDFTEKKIGDLAKRVWWDGKMYWIKGAKGWFSYNRDDFRLYCKGVGFSDKTVKGRTVTEIEEVLLHVHEHRRINAAVPFVFKNQERVRFNGQDYLNTNQRFAMQPLADPAEGDPKLWPWMFRYLHGLFHQPCDMDLKALHCFLAWAQRAVLGALSNHPVPGHVLIMAGPPGRGKTLMTQFILGRIFGGFADASEFLLKGGFNKELAEVGLWCVDDGTTAANFNDHKKFTEMLKRHVANPNISYHPKFKDTTMLPWQGRIMVTCNLDADSLSVLPNMDANILDKLMLFKLTHPTPETKALFNDYDVELVVTKELPHFLTWLVNWTPPADLVALADSRYGVAPFHHPDLLASARDASPDHRFIEVIDLFCDCLEGIERENSYWEGTASALLKRMEQIDGMGSLVRSYNNRQVGRVLGKLKELHPHRISSRMLHGNSVYRIELALEKRMILQEDPVSIV